MSAPIMDDVMYWEAVCKKSSPFWDSQIVWNSSVPDLTPCFQKTVLNWAPCVIIWLLCPIEIYGFYQSRLKQIPWTILSISKLVICLLLFLIDLFNLLTLTTFEKYKDDFYLVDGLSAVLHGCTMVLAATLIWLGKHYGRITSVCLQCFWFIHSVAAGLLFRSFLIRALDEVTVVDVTEFVLSMMCFPIVLSQFLLSIPADARPQFLKFTNESPKDLTKEETASFMSKIFFMWYDSIALLGYRRPLEVFDLKGIKYSMKCKTIVKKFDEALRKVFFGRRSITMQPEDQDNQEILPFTAQHNLKNDQPFLSTVLFKVFGWSYVEVIILRLIADGFTFLSPLILSLLIEFVSTNEPIWHGYIYAGGLALATFMEAICMTHCFKMSNEVSLKVRSTLMSYIYRKSLKLSSKAKSQTTVGEIVNHMAIDAQKIVNVIDISVMTITSPLQLIIAIVELWMFLGPSSLVSMLVILIIQGITFMLMRRIKKLQVIFMKLKDQRIKLMNEVLNGVKLLKLFAWEMPFADYVTEFRQRELAVLRKLGYMNATMIIFWGSSSVVISLAVFAVYVLIDPYNILDASTAFVSLTIFGLIRRPLMMLPNFIASFVEASVSMKRLNKYSWNEEINRDDIQPQLKEGSAIFVKDGNFSWGDENTPCLKDINLDIQEGSLVAVVGPVGSGKSSLLMALLGEMNKIGGFMAHSRNIAYASQIPWIQNTTLKNNILFGKACVESKYRKVIEATALLPDLNVLPAGDITEIGEKGINLSGGQKQRISMARAIYNDASIYLLDDPLSAVDAHVGKHLFNSVIGPKGMLRKKTRVLVTHNLAYVAQTDMIIVLNNGTVTEMGSYEDLMNQQGPFADLIATYVANGKENDDKDLPKKSDAKETQKLAEMERQVSAVSTTSVMSDKSTAQSEMNDKQSVNKGELIKTETVEKGKVQRKVYIAYVREYGPFIFLMLSALILANICNGGSSIWLSQWSNDLPNPDGSQDVPLRNLRLSVYGVLGLGYGALLFFGGLFMILGSIRASSNFHSNMLYAIFHAPQWFFDVTPVGRILNRFSSDIDTVDMPLSQNLRMWITFVLQLVVGVVIIIMEIPLFTLAAVPAFVLFYYVQKFYIESGRQIRRLDSVTRSPIYSSFSEAVSGVYTIRAYRHEGLFFDEFSRKVDTNVTCSYLALVSQRWLTIRMEFVGALLLLLAGIFTIIGKEGFSPGIVGLVLSYTISITANLKLLFNTQTLLETNIVSVERIMNYTSEVPQEPDWIKPDSRPPSSWPTNGTIKFHAYETKYRDELDTVLKGITCTIRGSEKVGIVGRTGAGKSSLTLSLFRIIESTSGHISIDDIDIATIGLHDLRSKLTIIPQDPVLFSGTLRHNLDPFNKHSDSDIWTVLEHSHLKEFVSSLPGTLEYQVSEGGENLSVGQRQLVCLARALLRKSQVLVLDEATAAIDMETDDVIQATIRQEFADCTVLTVAHRLNTIMDADRVMVLDKGLIKECDSPTNLLQNKDSIFYSMAKNAGLV